MNENDKSAEKAQGAETAKKEEVIKKPVETILDGSENIPRTKTHVIPEALDKKPLTPEEAVPVVAPTKPEVKPKPTFKELLEVGAITIGDKVSFVPAGAEKKTIIVDAAFLGLSIKDEEYYDKYSYQKEE